MKKIGKNMLEEKEHRYSALGMAINMKRDWPLSGINEDDPAYYFNEFDYDLSLLNLEDEYQIYESREYRYNPYNLKYYYNIIKFDETMKKAKEDEYQTKIDKFWEYDIQELPVDAYVELFNESESAEYFDDVKVLVIDDYPICKAYKIGETFEECEFIGCHYELNEIYKTILEYIGKNLMIKDTQKLS